MLCAELTAANVMSWMFVSFQNSYVEIQTASMVAVGNEAFRTGLGHEGGVLVTEISALKGEPSPVRT